MLRLLVLLFVAIPAIGFSQLIIKETADRDASVKIRCGTPGAPVKPLIIVNGFELDSKHLNKVNPSQILSIHILKDKSATDAYGEKAKDGVIKITTKQEAMAELVKEGLITPIL